MSDRTADGCHHGWVTAVAEGVSALRAAAADGRLDAVCARHRIRVLTVFGSAVRHPATARDLDIAVLPERPSDLDVLRLLEDLVELSGLEGIDLARLDAASPLLAERALVGCIPLHESVEGAYADAQSAAIGQRVETDHLRRLDLELLAR